MSSQNIVMIITAENRAGQTLQQVREQVDQTTQKVQINFKDVALGASSATAGIVSFATSFSSIDKAALQARRAQTAYEASLVTVDQAQKRVNDLINKGRQGTTEYDIAVQQLAVAQQRVTDAADKAKLAQDAYNDRVLNFAAGIAPQMISITFGIQKVMDGLKFNFTDLSIVMQQRLIPAITNVRVASIAAFITNPVGLAIIGITTLVTLLVFNVGGLRDAIVDLGRRIFEFIQQHLKPLADLLSWLNDSVVQPLARTLGITAVESTNKASNAFNNFEQETIQLGHGLGALEDQITNEVIPAMNPGITENVKAVETVFKGTEAVIQRNIELYGKIGRTAVENAEIMLESSSITVTGLSAIEQILIRIQQLQQGHQQRVSAVLTAPVSARGTPLLSTAQNRAGGLPSLERLREEGELVGAEIARLQRMAQSLALATGAVSPLGLFGGGTQFLGGLGGNITLSPFGNQLVTEFGTLLSTLSGAPFSLFSQGGNTVTLAQAIQMGLGLNRLDVGAALNLLSGPTPVIRDFRTLTREQFFALTSAQHGFEGMVTRPTIFSVAEAGPEHVSVTPFGSAKSVSDDTITINIFTRDPETDVEAIVGQKRLKSRKVHSQLVVA